MRLPITLGTFDLTTSVTLATERGSATATTLATIKQISELLAMSSPGPAPVRTRR